MSENTRLKRRAYRRLLERYQKELPKNRAATPGRHSLILVLDHLKAEFNIGKIFRSADSFDAREIHLIDIAAFDPKPSKGGFRHVPARMFPTVDQSLADLRPRGYSLFALDPAGETSVFDISLPERSAFIVGHEEWGLSFDPSAYAGVKTLAIPRFGSSQSLNVAVAASILMYEYVRQHQGAVSPRPAVSVGRRS